MLTVEEAKLSGVIPAPWHDVIPSKCECGSNLHISKNLKTTICSNVKCIFKVSNRAAEMLQNLGVKGMGQGYCEGFFKQNGVTELSHLHILTATPEEHNRYYNYETRVNHYNNIQEALAKPRTFKEVVSALALPRLNQTAYKIFKGNNSFEEALAEILEYDMEPERATCAWVAYKLQRGGMESTQKISEVLNNFTKELLAVPKIFTIKPEAKVEIVIAITGSPSLSGCSKDVYMSRINNIASDSITVVRKDNRSGVQFILADSESNNSKYIYGKNNNLLITSVDFEQFILALKDELEGGISNE